MPGVVGIVPGTARCYLHFLHSGLAASVQIPRSTVGSAMLIVLIDALGKEVRNDGAGNRKVWQQIQPDR